MKATAILQREIDSAGEQDREILHVRVTLDALRGSPASVPVTLERLRALDWDHEGRHMHGRDGFASNASPLELLVHPSDWSDALGEIPTPGDQVTPTMFRGYRVLNG